MKEYQIFLKNDKVKFYHHFSWLIIIANFSVILYATYGLNKFREMKWSFLLVALLFLMIFVFQHYLKDYFRGKAKLVLPFLFIMYAWAFLGFPWLMMLNLVLLLLSLITGRLPLVYLNQTHIIYPAFPKRSIQWSELNNVILKDGYLTIDFKNDKFIQQLVDEKQSIIDEKEFNEFCQQQLNK
jgi:hypothetical protein